jgi:hypothetical protein
MLQNLYIPVAKYPNFFNAVEHAPEHIEPGLLTSLTQSNDYFVLSVKGTGCDHAFDNTNIKFETHKDGCKIQSYNCDKCQQ